MRDGFEQQIMASDIVPGDIILLKSGDKVRRTALVRFRFRSSEACNRPPSGALKQRGYRRRRPERTLSDRVGVVFGRR